MILKMATYNEGWIYRDNIATVHQGTTTPEIYKNDYNNKGRQYDSVLLDCYKQTDTELLRIYPDTTRVIKEISVYFENGATETYLTDRDTYLMSDEGKTIERIN